MVRKVADKKKKATAASSKETAVAAPAKQVKKRKPTGIAAEPDGIPTDLRGRKRAGRPDNAERAKTESIDEKVSLICADWLDDIKKARKSIPIDLKVKALPNMLKHLVRDEEQDDESDVTLVLLADRYLGSQKQFNDAEEMSKRDAQVAAHHNAKQSSRTTEAENE